MPWAQFCGEASDRSVSEQPEQENSEHGVRRDAVDFLSSPTTYDREFCTPSTTLALVSPQESSQRMAHLSRVRYKGGSTFVEQKPMVREVSSTFVEVRCADGDMHTAMTAEISLLRRRMSSRTPGLCFTWMAGTATVNGR